MPIAEKWTNTSSPPSRSMKPKPFSFENHLTVPSANYVTPYWMTMPSVDRRNGKTIPRVFPACKELPPVNAGADDRVLEQAGDRHRADAAGYRRHQRGDVGNP